MRQENNGEGRKREKGKGERDIEWEDRVRERKRERESCREIEYVCLWSEIEGIRKIHIDANIGII